MSQLSPSLNLARDILQQIEAGDMAGVARTLTVIDAEANLPHVCNPEMLAALDKARSLVLVQRCGILRNLRTLEARRLYCAPSRQSGVTWQMEG